MKKILTAIAVVLLCIPMVFAEGTKETAKPAEPELKLNPVGTYPIVNEPVTIDIMVAQEQCVEDFNTNEFSKYLEEMTGVHINYIMVPRMAAAEKLNLTLAGDEWPDAFLGFKLTPDLEALYGVEEHLIQPLNKYYSEEYMPNMMKAFEDFPGGIGFMTNIDGNIYSLPTLLGCFHCSNCYKMWVNNDFLENLGLEDPQTTEEFYEALKAIKYGDPNGNGKADEIPLMGATEGWGTSVETYLLNSFCFTDLLYNITTPPDRNIGYYVDNGTVKTMVDSDEYREGLKYINKLYEEGLLYNASFTQNGEQMTQLIESGDVPTVGFATGGWRGCFQAADSERFYNTRAIAPLEGPKGVREAGVELQNPQPGSLFINADSPYAEVLCRVFDYMYTYEGQVTQVHGKEGIGWKKAEEGQLGLDGKQGLYDVLIPYNSIDPQNHTWIVFLIGACPYALFDGQVTPQISVDDPEYYSIKFNEKSLRDQTANLYKPYEHPEKALPTLKFTSAENDEYATQRVEYAKYVRSEGVKFCTGILDPNSDKDWNNYLDNLNKLNKEGLLEIQQVAYDRMFK